MLELLLVFGALALGAAIFIGMLKLLVALVLLPLKIAFLAAKGVIGLVLVVPLFVIGLAVLVNVFPVIIFVLLLPVIIVGAMFALLLKLIF